MASETLADIVAEMRYGTVPKHRTDHELLALYADRIEAAAKREISEVVYAYDPTKVVRSKAPDPVAYALEGMRNDPAYKSLYEKPQSGNAAAMREALYRLLNLAYEVQDLNSECGPKTSVPAQFVIDVAKSALSAPPRNCDRPEASTTKQEGGNDEQK